jgi:hypothetical protein
MNGMDAIPGGPEECWRPEKSIWPDMRFINYANRKKQIVFQEYLFTATIPEAHKVVVSDRVKHN